MIDYRLFFMTEGRIRGAAEFSAEDDAAAIAHAETLRTGAAAELWSRARCVARFTADASDAAFAPPTQTVPHEERPVTGLRA